ncbi:MAG: GNAT family N-acetyltransferase [Lachnospiraceae bacterium]
MCLTEIRGNKITIRETVIEDAMIMQGWWSDGKIMALEGYPDGFKENVSDVKKVIKNKSISRGLFLIMSKSGEPIGECSFDRKTKGACFVSLKICDYKFIHKGYGTDALYAFVNYLFQTYQLDKIKTRVLVDHEWAQQLFLKTGFFVVYVDKNCWTDPTGKIRSFVELEIVKERFEHFYRNYKKVIEVSINE